MKRLVLIATAGLMLGLGPMPGGHAIEILHWERLPLAVPLVVGQERVVFIDRNVRIDMVQHTCSAMLRSIELLGGAEAKRE